MDRFAKYDRLVVCDIKKTAECLYFCLFMSIIQSLQYALIVSCAAPAFLSLVSLIASPVKKKWTCHLLWKTFLCWVERSQAMWVQNMEILLKNFQNLNGLSKELNRNKALYIHTNIAFISSIWTSIKLFTTHTVYMYL